jgi:AraC family transcriptional activator of pobA
MMYNDRISNVSEMEEFVLEDRSGQLGLKGTTELHILPDVQTTFQLFAAHLRRVETPWSYPAHTHALFELNVVTEGKQLFTIESDTFEQTPGDIVIVRPGERHRSVADDSPSMGYFCLHFQVDDPMLRRLLLALDRGSYRKGSVLEERIGPAVQRLMELATASTNDESPAVRMLTLSAVYGLLAALSETSSIGTEKTRTHKPASLQASRLAASIARSIERSVTYGEDGDAAISDIARAVGYSVTYCSRVFRDAYGMSPRAFRSSVVLREAKLLLLDPERSIENIAERLGYGDAATFSKQFRRWTGMSPREYRTI